MNPIVRRIAAVAVAAFAIAAPAQAQFGQNKIAYDRYDWKVYPSPHFDVHYYGEQEPFLEDVVSYAESAYLQISKDLDHELRFRVPLIIYKTHQEFRQTNITLFELPDAVLAFAEPIQNRMVLPIDLPQDELYALIAHELVHIFQYSIFFEGNLGRAVRSNPPRWLFEGMASYLAEDESNLDRMAIRDAVVNNFLPPIQALDYLSFLTYRYGHALFDFIEQEHGEEGFRNFIYGYRQVLLANNLEKAVKDTFGYDIDEFNRRFNRYLRKKYFPVLLEKKHPDDYGTEIGARKRVPAPGGRPTFSPALSPSGELVAALSQSRMELDLVVLSAENGKLIRNLTKGWTNDYQNLITEAFAGKRDLAWSPVGDQVAVFVKKENRRPLYVYDALTGKRVREIDLGDIYESTAPAFSPDGRRIAFEGNLDGVIDLFEIDLESGEIRNLTQDEFYDTNPWYSPDGSALLYNRRIGSYWKIFQVDLDDATRKTQLTFGPSSDLQPSYARDGSRVYFSSDQDPNGVFNLYALDLTSGEIRQYTDVVGGCFAPVETVSADDERSLVFVAYYAGSFRLYRMPLLDAERSIAIDDRMANPIEAEPFEPPLRLTLDDDRKRDYKLLWDIEAPSIAVGVTDDGTILSQGQVTFSDLLGDQRIDLFTQTYDTFSNTLVRYRNLSRRWNWGAQIYDFRDYYLTIGGTDQIQRTTGAGVFWEYPMSRYYRFETGVGFLDRSQDFFTGFDPNGFAQFQTVKEQYATASASLVGDTTRFQGFGPFQGKRFNLSVLYGANTGGDVDGDLLDYRLDFRTYKQATRRSTLAWRLFGLWSDGDRQSLYGIGGINYLRGYDFREFFGSRVVVSNLEFRFPLVDRLDTPIGPLGPLRGFFFFDVAAAWLQDDLWWDPDLRTYRGLDTGQDLPFEFWDSDNDRLQDGRATYGFGIQFFFSGLQLNWSWAERLPYTQYVRTGPGDPTLIPIENDGGDRRFDFYIVYDF